jgi:hypothetical protein
MCWAGRLLVLLGEEFRSGLEIGEEACGNLLGGRVELIVIGPPKIVGAKDVCFIGEEENSVRARGLNPDF